MVARLLWWGITLGILSLAYLGIAPLSAAQASNSYSALASGATGRIVFGPASAGGQASRALSQPVSRYRGAGAHSPRRNAAEPPSAVLRTGARKAVPVTRGQELGLRFRPDERESPYTQYGAPYSGSGGGGDSAASQSQFRPMERRRKPTYEELYAEPTFPTQPMPGPMMPYPMLAPPLPGYGRGWPDW